MITAKQLLAVLPKCRDPNITARVLGSVAEEFKINTKQRFALFAAQCAHESSFSPLRENLSYSSRRLMQVWPSRFPTEAAAAPFERQPEKLANTVYADRLGNGPAESGDGWRFRGGGWLQLTGRANYRKADETLKVQLEQYPQRIEKIEVAGRTAGLFWSQHGLNEMADEGNFEAVCKRINGGATGIEARRELWLRFQTVLP